MNLIINILIGDTTPCFWQNNICLLVLDPGELACLKLINAAGLVD